MEPLPAHHAIWLARGEALGILLRLLQRGLRAGARRLRFTRLVPRRREIGFARRRLSDG